MNKFLNISNHDTNFKVNPIQFTTWLFLVSVAMLFAALTSAYIVRKGAGDWIDISLPSSFVFSTIVVVVSSFAMYLAQRAYKSSNKALLLAGLVGTFILGAAFCYFQFQAWAQLNDQSIYLVGHNSGSFLYVISGVHLAHIMGGLLFLIIAIIKTLINSNNEIKSQNIPSLATYWHFVGILWIYLYVFLYIA